MNQQSADNTHSFASATRGLRHVFVNRLSVDANIGIHPHERKAPQTVLVSLDAAVSDNGNMVPHNIDQVVCYESMTKTVIALIAEGHVDLVETLAERIADSLLQDTRIRQLRVQVEKPDAIAAAASVGITIERLQRA